MAQNYWLGTAPAVAEVDTFTPGGSITTGDANTLTVKDESGTTIATITFTVGGTATAAAVVTGLIAAWNANATTAAIATPSGTSTFILTAKSPGVPFYVTSSVTGVGTLTRAATTANSGPSDWNTAANWYTGSVPVGSDSVYIDGSAAASILYGLNQSGVTLAGLYVLLSMAYNIGTRAFALKIGATILELGRPPTDGTNKTMGQIVNIDTGSVQTTLTVYGSRPSGSGGLPPINWKGTHASNVATVYGGIVGFGSYVPGAAYTLATASVLNNAQVTFGSGGTLTTVNTEDNCNVTLGCAATTINQLDPTGTITTTGSGAVTTFNVSGHAVCNSTGTISTLNVQGKGFADFEQSSVARTVTNTTLTGPDCKLSCDNGVPKSVTFTNPIAIGKGARSTQVNFGTGVNVQQS